MYAPNDTFFAVLAVDQDIKFHEGNLKTAKFIPEGLTGFWPIS